MSANQDANVSDDDPRMAWPQGSASTSDDLVDFSDFTWPGRDDNKLVTSYRDLSLLLQPLTHFEVNDNNFEDSLLAPNTTANLQNDVNGLDLGFAGENTFAAGYHHNPHPLSEDPEQLALRALEATDFSDLLHAHPGTHNLGAEMGAGLSVGAAFGNVAGPDGYVGGRADGIDLRGGYATDHGPHRMGGYGELLFHSTIPFFLGADFDDADPVLLAGTEYPPLDCSLAPTSFPTCPVAGPSYPATSTNYGLEPFRFVASVPLCAPYAGVGVHPLGHYPEHGGGSDGLMTTTHDFGGSFGAGNNGNPTADDLPDEWFTTATNVGLGITYDFDNVAPGGVDGGDNKNNGLPNGAAGNIVFDNDEALAIQAHDGAGTQAGAGVPDDSDLTWAGPLSIGDPAGPVSVGDPAGPVSVGDPADPVLVDDSLSTLYTRPGGSGSYRFVGSVDDAPDVPEGSADSTAAAVDVDDAKKPAVRRRPRPDMPSKTATPASNKVKTARKGTKRKAPDDDIDDVDGLDTSRFPTTRSPSATSYLLAAKDKVDITAALNDPAVPKDFERKLPTVADEPDPWACHICYHTFIRQPRLRDHYLEKHPELRLTRKTVKEYAFAKAENCHRLSWYIARGDDTTYTGTDRKQFNARRRMAAGIKTDSPEYLLDVYKTACKLREKENRSKRSKE